MLELALTVLVATVLLAAGVVPLLIHFCIKHKLFDPPGLHKRHPENIPVLGGVGLFVTVWPALFLALQFGDAIASLTVRQVVAIFGGAVIITSVGVLDDIKTVSAWPKLAAQVAAGLALGLGGFSVDTLALPFMGTFELGGFGWVISVAWVVLLSNAINFIDGLDGLASGVAAIACLTLGVIAFLYESMLTLMFAVSVLGYLIVFLRYNTFPARIFLGDSGSLQIGYYFAVMSLLVPLKTYTAAALYLPLLALGVPLLEAASSVMRRVMTGQNPMSADRSHLFHRLSEVGLTDKKVVTLFYFLAIIFSGFTLAMYLFNKRIVAAALFVFMVVILSAFFIFVRRRNGRSRRRDGEKSLGAQQGRSNAPKGV